MATQGNAAPVIIKRKKVISGGGHHGGAWKVAYADFVTAMMAFFMLMWLLNATTEKQRKGLADYFNPTIPINRISGGGDGVFGGDSVFAELSLSQNGTGAVNRYTSEDNQTQGATGVEPDSAAKEGQDAQFNKIEEALFGRGGESMVTENPMKHVLTRVTDEGLVIELFDLEHIRLFATDSDEPETVLTDLIGMIAEVASLVQNRLAIEGHTSSKPIVVRNDTSWELSSTRANKVRKLLENAGLAAQRIVRVTGHANREAVTQDLMAVRNNRIEIILLRSDL